MLCVGLLANVVLHVDRLLAGGASFVCLPLWAACCLIDFEVILC